MDEDRFKHIHASCTHRLSRKIVFPTIFQPCDRGWGQFHSADISQLLAAEPLLSGCHSVTKIQKHLQHCFLTYYFRLGPQKSLKTIFSVFFPAFALHIPLSPRLDPAAEPTTADPSTYFAGFALRNEGQTRNQQFAMVPAVKTQPSIWRVHGRLVA